MNLTFKYAILVVFILLVTHLWSQQESHFSLYRYHFNMLNPAFSGSQGAAYVNMGYRSQWTGVKDAPVTQVVSFETPTKERRVGLGFSVINDKTFVEKQLQVFANFSYRLQLNENLDLYLGIQGGINAFAVNGSQLNVFGSPVSDPKLLNYSKLNPNIGVGLYLKHERFYVSLSTPKILNSERFKKTEGITTTATDKVHVYTQAGFNFPISKSFEFIPSFLLSFVKGAPARITLNGAVSYNKKIDFGFEYNFQNGFGSTIMFNTNKLISFGYAYITSIHSQLNTYSKGTHEALIKIKLSKENVPLLEENKQTTNSVGSEIKENRKK